MRMLYFAAACVICMSTGWLERSADAADLPREIGNRANGFNYQPTPQEVVPRESAAGVRPSDAHQIAVDHQLEQLDRELLHDEGLPINSAPVFSARAATSPGSP